MKILITDCDKCPFANNDNEYGKDGCNLANYLSMDIKLIMWETLPENGVHKDCPLKLEDINISL